MSNILFKEVEHTKQISTNFYQPYEFLPRQFLVDSPRSSAITASQHASAGRSSRVGCGRIWPEMRWNADQRPAFELPGNGSANDQSNEPSWAQDENMSSIWSSPCPGDGSFFQLVFGFAVFFLVKGMEQWLNTIPLVLQFIGGVKH